MLHSRPLEVRPAAVAGAFYPGAAGALRDAVDRLLQAEPAQLALPPKALIAPHAGYRYSGPIAAAAYRSLLAHADSITRVVLIGPAHRVAVRGIALPDANAFATPLGSVRIDADAVRQLRGLPWIVSSAAAHAEEHALEVQLPFLQATLGEFTLVPLLVGQATTDEVARALECVWGSDETLIIASSDLSHYLPYEIARSTDAGTVDAVLHLGPDLDPGEACGAGPINGLLRQARSRSLIPVLLDLRNSGDTSGDRARVVGYASVAFSDPRFGRQLLELARHAIEAEFGTAQSAEPDDQWLARKIGCFVTLRRGRELRGCVGAIEPDAPLAEELRSSARAAAFKDPRFAPLSRTEFEGLTIEVSLLTPTRLIEATSDDELASALRPEIDGVSLRSGERHATFLPQVWRQVATPRDFVRQLKMKAGLSIGEWPADIRITRYCAQSWSES
jgi:AmmeMemoRadiSam system protein B/AmmeMemoRadiSam system protein A